MAIRRFAIPLLTVWSPSACATLSEQDRQLIDTAHRSAVAAKETSSRISRRAQRQ